MKHIFQVVHFALNFIENGRDPGPLTWGFYVYRATSAASDERDWNDYLDYLRKSALQFLLDNCELENGDASPNEASSGRGRAGDQRSDPSDRNIDEISGDIDSLSLGETRYGPTSDRTGNDATHRRQITPEDSRLISTFQFRVWEHSGLTRTDIDQARVEFGNWARNIRDEHPQQFGVNMSRYRYFLFVNDEVLQQFKTAQNAGDLRCDASDDVVSILVEAHLSRWEERDEDDEEGEDDPDFAMGWQYVRPWGLPTMYDGLSYGNYGWYDMFVAPPGVRLAFYD